MTGKQLKEFAAKVSDETVIEHCRDSYGTSWSALEATRLRAVYQCPEPSKEETHEHL